jgi:hypothetical protein
MTTSTASQRFTWFDRMVDWVLDRDGDIYGDERARIRWYEGIAASASIQWFLVMWALAIAAWSAPASAAPYLWAIAAAFFFPLYISIFYLSRRGVDYDPPQKSRKARIIQLVTFLPMAGFMLGMTVGRDLRQGESWSDLSPGIQGGVVGGFVGLGIGVIVRRVLRARRERRLAESGDLD